MHALRQMVHKQSNNMSTCAHKLPFSAAFSRMRGFFCSFYTAGIQRKSAAII
jgi:hypothetical protein